MGIFSLPPQIASVFSSVAAESAELVSRRQKEMAPKDGQISVFGRFESYIAKITTAEGAIRNETCVVPPREVEKRSPKDPKKKWNDALKMWVRLENVSPVPGRVERRVDPVTGAVVFVVSIESKPMGDKVTRYLADHAQHAWTHDDPDSLALRNYVTADGLPTSRYWKEYSADDVIKVTSPDRKNSVFREEVAPNLFRVQPGAPVRFYNIEPVAFLGLGEEESGGEEGAGEVKLRAYVQFQCKSHASVGEEYDPFLERSEREHMIKNKDVHNLIPVEQFRANDRLIPHHAYFYVSRGYQTQMTGNDPTQRGVAVMRERVAQPSNFLRVVQDKQKAWFKVSFDVFQFVGAIPGGAGGNSFDQYNVQVLDLDENGWRQAGITDEYTYSLIMAAHTDLPFHLQCELWTTSVKNNPANDPKTLRNKPELAHMQGYYTYGVKSTVFDFLRYFRTRGLRVSPAWVENDFRGSCLVNARQKKTIQLRPADPTKANPLNVAGARGAVLALGNGVMRVDERGDDVPLYHAWEGNVLPLLEGGEHDFYVLLSKPEEHDGERAQFMNGALADAYVSELVEREQILYWIYAVRKDAKMAPNFQLEGERRIGDTRKRERDEGEEQHLVKHPREEGEEYE